MLGLQSYVGLGEIDFMGLHAGVESSKGRIHLSRGNTRVVGSHAYLRSDVLAFNLKRSES